VASLFDMAKATRQSPQSSLRTLKCLRHAAKHTATWPRTVHGRARLPRSCPPPLRHKKMASKDEQHDSVTLLQVRSLICVCTLHRQRKP
jgi:hypothetical protein